MLVNCKFIWFYPQFLMPNLIFLVSLSGTETEMGDTEASLEGWLQTPSKQNIRRHGWKKLYVVVSKRKIIFFNSEMDKQNSDPTLILDLNKVSIIIILVARVTEQLLNVKWIISYSDFFTSYLRLRQGPKVLVLPFLAEL